MLALRSTVARPAALGTARRAVARPAGLGALRGPRGVAAPAPRRQQVQGPGASTVAGTGQRRARRAAIGRVARRRGRGGFRGPGGRADRGATGAVSALSRPPAPQRAPRHAAAPGGRTAHAPAPPAPHACARTQGVAVVASALGAGGDVPVSGDTLGAQAPTMRNLAFGSFWVQLPLSVVSACILFFAVQFTRTVRRRGGVGRGARGSAHAEAAQRGARRVRRPRALGEAVAAALACAVSGRWQARHAAQMAPGPDSGPHPHAAHPRSPAPQQPADVSRWFTLIGIACAFISTFFAHGFLTLARQAINQGKAVSRSYLVQNLVSAGACLGVPAACQAKAGPRRAPAWGSGCRTGSRLQPRASAGPGLVLPEPARACPTLPDPARSPPPTHPPPTRCATPTSTCWASASPWSACRPPVRRAA
jgi:hypothetical protein